MRYFLSRFEYPGKDASVVGVPDPLLVIRGIDAVGD
jgi:polyphosphate kinase